VFIEQAIKPITWQPLRGNPRIEKIRAESLEGKILFRHFRMCDVAMEVQKWKAPKGIKYSGSLSCSKDLSKQLLWVLHAVIDQNTITG
jgi:hypothetical protein